MYRHLLVPTDGTELSTVTVGRAIDFALAVGARITFFHARRDLAGSILSDPDMVRRSVPADFAAFARNFDARTRELLDAAEAQARARGVPCASAAAVSEAPYAAIIDAARAAGCDLIYMASHGRRSTLGMMIGSQTLKVLVNSEIPVLVAATAQPATTAAAAAPVAATYRHLLVPIDGSDLSTMIIDRAVDFALTVGARISFFHADPDYASSFLGDAEIVRMTAPSEYAYSFEGRARELLAKAEAAARARGVPCASISAVSDTPYAVIIDAARGAGCDLIYMASHGRRSTLGMMIGSQTLKVLVNSEIPVLVASTAQAPIPDQAQAIAIIRDEHRSLAAVLHAWKHLLATAAAQPDARPDAGLMRAMIRYIEDFPVALHHPKEDDYLFRRLRERTPTANPELDELERQHLRAPQQVRELAELVERYAEGKASVAELEQGLARYTQELWEHMGREEGVILPLAQRHLTEADWFEINQAFQTNGDPRFGGDTDAEFKQLFSRIVNLAPQAE